MNDATSTASIVRSEGMKRFTHCGVSRATATHLRGFGNASGLKCIAPMRAYAIVLRGMTSPQLSVTSSSRLILGETVGATCANL